jgi:hypothetical protein
MDLPSDSVVIKYEGNVDIKYVSDKIQFTLNSEIHLNKLTSLCFMNNTGVDGDKTISVCTIYDGYDSLGNYCWKISKAEHISYYDELEPPNLVNKFNVNNFISYGKK